MPDSLGHSDAEGIEVAGHAVNFLEAVSFGSLCAGNGNPSAFQAILQHFHHIFVVWQKIQTPRLHPLIDGRDKQFRENAPVFQLLQHVVPKLRDQWGRGLVIQFLKQPLTVSRRAEQVAFSRL